MTPLTDENRDLLLSLYLDGELSPQQARAIEVSGLTKYYTLHRHLKEKRDSILRISLDPQLTIHRVLRT